MQRAQKLSGNICVAAATNRLQSSVCFWHTEQSESIQPEPTTYSPAILPYCHPEERYHLSSRGALLGGNNNKENSRHQGEPVPRLEKNIPRDESYQQTHLEKLATRRARGQIQVGQTADSTDVAYFSSKCATANIWVDKIAPR